MRVRVVLLLALIALASCATRPPAESGEFFDDENASTLLVAAQPLVFARDRSDVAAHGRDFATLVAVEIDNSGDYAQYLLLYRWSTVDRRMSPPPGPDAGLLRILADGRAIDLKPLERFPVNVLQRRQLHMPKHDDVVTRGYKIDPSTLNYIATSTELLVRMPQEPLATPFTLWEDGRNALKQFLLRAVAP
jgi:hypothetical protein